jgi:hypothetical protein
MVICIGLFIQEKLIYLNYSLYNLDAPANNIPAPLPPLAAAPDQPQDQEAFAQPDAHPLPPLAAAPDQPQDQEAFAQPDDNAPMDVDKCAVCYDAVAAGFCACNHVALCEAHIQMAMAQENCKSHTDIDR